MTADTITDDIRALRAALDEDTTAFAAHFCCSARTIEDWEQGRRHPDRLAQQVMVKLWKRVSSRRGLAIAKAKKRARKEALDNTAKP